MRPLQEEIRKRGDNVAWYLEPGCPDLLTEDELRLTTFEQVAEFDACATFTPGNVIYPWFPGIHVQLFHGYPISKRGEKSRSTDDHFAVRGWFDMYCTQGSSSTEYFKELSKKHGFFKVYETGWSKVDPYFEHYELEKNHKPTVLYGTTFTKGISSAPVLVDTIGTLVEEKDWNWILTFHPKIKDQSLLNKYRALAQEHENVKFVDNVRLQDFQNADVMLSDSSSIILEFMLMDKPVVTLRNTTPGSHLINVDSPDEIRSALETAMTRPDALMNKVKHFAEKHEAHRDGNNCERILEAVDDFITNYKGRLKAKPMNLLRKFKLRKRLGYWKLN